MKKWILFQVPVATHTMLRLLAATRGQPLCALMVEAAALLLEQREEEHRAPVALEDKGTSDCPKIPHRNCYPRSNDGSVKKDEHEMEPLYGESSSDPDPITSTKASSCRGGVR